MSSLVLIALIILVALLCRKTRDKPPESLPSVSGTLKPPVPPKPVLNPNFNSSLYSSVDYNRMYSRQPSENDESDLHPEYQIVKDNPMYAEDEHGQLEGVYNNDEMDVPPSQPPAHYNSADDVTYSALGSNSQLSVPSGSSHGNPDYENSNPPPPAPRPSVFKKNPNTKDTQYINHRYGRHRDYANPELLTPDAGVGLDNDSVSGIHPAAQFALPSKPAEFNVDYPYQNTDTLSSSTLTSNKPLSQMFQQSYVQYQNSLARTHPPTD